MRRTDTVAQALEATHSVWAVVAAGTRALVDLPSCRGRSRSASKAAAWALAGIGVTGRCVDLADPRSRPCAPVGWSRLATRGMWRCRRGDSLRHEEYEVIAGSR